MTGRTLVLRRYEDPEASRDPAIRALVADLRAAPTIPGPSDAFRAELRAQLVAVAPRLVTEGVLEPARGVATGHHRAPARTRRSYGRPFAVAGATFGLLGVVFAGAVYASSGAEPGDALYGLKRAGENVNLALTSGDAARGKVYLKQSQTRLAEVQTLLTRTSALALGSGPSAIGTTPNAHTVSLIDQTLASADSELRSGTRLITTGATRSASAAPLDVLITWATGQNNRFSAVADRLPSGAVRDRVLSSQHLLQQAQQRGDALKVPLTSSRTCLSTSGTDQFGVLPCTTPKAPTPRTTTGPGVTTSTVPAPGGGTPGPGTTSGPTASTPTAPGQPTAGLPTAGVPTSVPGTSALPTRPGGVVITAPGSVSVGLGSCTVGAAVPPLTVAVTLCPSHR